MSGEDVERNRVLMERFRSSPRSYPEFFGNPDRLADFYHPYTTVFEACNHAEWTSGWTGPTGEFFARWPEVTNQNNRAWPFEDGWCYRHEHRIPMPHGGELWSPGFVINFIDRETGLICRMEEHMDSYLIEPLLRVSHGESRRFDRLRRQPPFVVSPSRLARPQPAVEVDPEAAKLTEERVGRNRELVGRIEEIRRSSGSQVKFFERLAQSFHERASVYQLADNSDVDIREALDKQRRFFSVWPDVAVENSRWWPFEEGAFWRVEYRFRTFRDVEVWCPGSVLVFSDGDRITRWEEYFDSYTMGPLQRIALGETRRHEQSRRQPPFP